LAILIALALALLAILVALGSALRFLVLVRLDSILISADRRLANRGRWLLVVALRLVARRRWLLDLGLIARSLA
jgi:hypothetical protein